MQFKNSYPLYFWSFLSQAILFSVLHFLFLFSFFFLFLNLSNKSGIFFLLLFFFCLFLYSFCLLEVFYEILKLGTNSSSNCFWFVSFPSCHICNIPMNAFQNYLIFMSSLYCWFMVSLYFVTGIASFSTVVAAATSWLYCIYVFDFALTSVAFSTCLFWNKSNCFWTNLSICKGHSKFQIPFLLA